MSVLKSFCCRSSHLRQYNALRPIVCHRSNFGVSYSTDADPPPPTLPGRKHVYEPDYLDLLKPKIPPYNLLNIQLKGYDYAVLERLQQSIHRLIRSMDLEVSDGWAVRAESWRIQRYAPLSSKSEAEFNLKEYKRVLQLSGLPSTKLSIVLELLQSVIPPGVTCSVVEHTEEMTKERFIPDFEVKALKEQLEEMGGPSKLALAREKEELYRGK